MSKYSHFLRKARNKADFLGLRAGIKLIVMILVVVYSLIGMSPTSVLAAAPITYYVNNTVPCNDLSSDTSTTPFCTITKGANKARFGDTVSVLAGTYAETVSISTWSGTLGNPITFSAAPGVIVTGNGTGTGSAFRIFGLTYITIDGFTVNSTAETGIYVSGSFITITNNHVTSTASHGIYAIGAPSNNVTISNNQVSTTGGSGIYLKDMSASTVSGNTSHHNQVDGIRLNRCSTVTVSNNTTFANDNNGIVAIGTISVPSYSNTILHNIVYANVDSGIQVDTYSHDNSVVGNLSYNNGDHGIDNNAATNQTIIGNTIQGNYTSGINLESGSTGATVANNLLVDNGLAPSAGNPYNIYVDSTSVTGTTLDYNLYYLTSPYLQQIYWNTTGYNSLAAFQVTGQEVHGLQADPLFVAPAAPATDPPSVVTGDYHLTAGSPAIDSANSNAPSEPTLDIHGNPRVDDPATPNTGTGTRAYDDRGAYEFQPTTTTVSTSGSPSIYGAPVTFTATVNQMAATGTVNFYDGASLIGSGTLATVSGQRQASYTIGAIQLTAITSPHSITATYLGDGIFEGSASSAISQVVNPKTASVTATDKIKTVGTGDPPLTTTHSGFIAGDLGAGRITFSATRVAGETAGTYDITPAAADAGTGLLGNYNVTYNHGIFTITTKLIPTVTVDCGANIVTFNGISCTVTVARPSGSDTPTGTVAWTTSGAGGFGGTTPCTLSTTGSGTETCSATYIPTAVGTGTHTVIAAYAGDANFAGISETKDVTVINKMTLFLPLILR